jgi:DNA-binding NarL/FixJ family response regulator
MKLLIADDHQLVLEGLRMVLEREPDLNVCALAHDGREAVELAAQFLPDVAILDLGMPGMNGIEATRQIRRKASPATQVLVLTAADSEELPGDACAAGARGYVLKVDGAAALVAGVRAVAEGRPYFSPGVRHLQRAVVGEGAAARPASPRRARGPSTHGRSTLTPREREITQLLVEGKTNWCVANILGISIKTVETHRASIMLKLGCVSIVELVHYAVRNLMVAP